MASEEILKLLEEAETKAYALSDEIDQAQGVLQSVDEMLENWTEGIATAREAAFGSLDSLSDRLATSETNLEQEEGELRESLANLTQKVEDCGNRIQTSLTEAFSQFNQLREQKQIMLTEISQELGDVGNVMMEVTQQCQQTENNLHSEVERLNQAAEEFGSIINGTLETCDKYQDALSEQLSGFTEGIEQAIASINEGSDHLVEHVNERVEGLEEPLQNVLKNSVETTENKQFEQVVGELDKYIVEVENAILQLVEDGMEVGGNLTESVDKVFEKTTAIDDLSQEINPVMVKAETVLV